jgi:uncharacterized protein YjiS (DUF1127 family)
MATNMNSRFSLSKFGEFIFARQTPYMEAETAPGIVDSLKAWWGRRSAEAELNRLSERDLSDIGLTRQGIRNAVRMRRTIR